MKRAGLFFSLIMILTAFGSVGAADREDAYRAARERMVRTQIEARGVTDARVLAAMREVPRHLFVPEDVRPAAYEDYPLPIGSGQTISQPYIVALMTELLSLEPGDRVFELGTGSGYQAAVASRICAEVFTVEIYPELAAPAARRLKELGYANAHTRQGDGYFGWPEAAPFDGILVTAAADHIPPPLVRQLRAGGRLVIPLGSPFAVQQLVLVTKSQDGVVTERPIIPVKFVPLLRP